ncbi:hypothetical protein FE257_010950 [Aspergillus nanangensis]|uniref:Alpha/beta hydrolase fold-3 domain-containing protein n=1 Tax=Aspergillus nanangensis TaxID=2582783 RepID=A0AAD4GZG2_ASPNN|nr:hypothetical protein FE257_010950 [Aspergillus nanangensis]
MPPKLPITTHLRLLATFAVVIVPCASLRAVRATIRAWIGGLPVGASMWNAFAGTLMTNVPADQLQVILPSTVDTYTAWMLASGNPSTVDVLDDDKTRLLWMGPKQGKKVVLFFHGGGYVMPLSKGHLEWMAHIRNEASRAGVQLSVCILEYDLIPTHPYPRQMAQATRAFDHLLASGYQPSDIIFGGDSAGGHLSLSLLSHLHHHRPSEAPAIHLTQRVQGCFLVSPLASFNLNSPSYRRWFSADVLDHRVVRKWGDYLIRNSPWQDEISAGQGWGMALDVSEQWWEGLNVVNRILVTGGYEEVFSDHIQQLGAVLGRNTSAEVVLYMAQEAHDGPLMDFAAGRAPSETTRAITDFIISSFSA